jgi:hypothetical protein
MCSHHGLMHLAALFNQALESSIELYHHTTEVRRKTTSCEREAET